MVSLIQIISALLNIITWLVIIDVVMSLLIQFRILDQRNQIVSQIWLSIRNVLEPLYSKIRSFLPNTIGFDLAPAVLLFGIFAIQTIIRNNFKQDDKIYSWWSYRNKDWKKSNRGRRLDHILMSKNIKKYTQSVKIYRSIRDEKKPSDHVPISVTLEV